MSSTLGAPERAGHRSATSDPARRYLRAGRSRRRLSGTGRGCGGTMGGHWISGAISRADQWVDEWGAVSGPFRDVDDRVEVPVPAQPLFGRDRELLLLREAMTRAAAGRPGIVVVA